MTGNVEVQDPAPAMLDDEEGVPQLEGQRGHGEEVEGHDPFPMVSQESQPALGRIAAAPQASQISGDRALGDLEAKLQKFPVDPRCIPSPNCQPPFDE